MNTIDWTRLGIVVVLALVVGGLAYLGKDAGYISAVLAALVAGALGFLRGPTQTSTPTATYEQTTPETHTEISVPVTTEEPKP